MEWLNTAISRIPRRGNFPLNVSGVYFCNDAKFPSSSGTFEISGFEVSVRLRSDAPICEDVIDGRVIRLPFPHVVFKYPGMKCALAGDLPRDTISFRYNTAGYQLLKEWKLIPDEKYWPVALAGILPELVEKFQSLCLSLTIDGTSDQLDWVCFQILREMVFAREDQMPPNSDIEGRIRRAAIYFQRNCNRSLTVGKVANRFGFSRAVFFREWKKIFPISPKEHILRSRLEISALRLIRSNLPVAEIAEEVNFSGMTEFYRKFREHFGVSPGEFRRSPELWYGIVPDIQPAEHG